MASRCCDTPHIARLQLIQENRKPPEPISAQEVLAQRASDIVSDTAHSLQTTGSFPTLPRDEMTDVVTPAYGGNMPNNDNNWNGTMPGSSPNPSQTIPAAPAPGSPVIDPEYSFAPGAPVFEVPSNPLLPPGYNETLDYASIQYLNGFYRTQIGRYVRIEQQINSTDIEIRYGFLIGVGINYLLLQDASTGNVYAIDSYSIKLFYVYYNEENPFPHPQFNDNPRGNTY